MRLTSFVALLHVLPIVHSLDYELPEQIHMTLGFSFSEMTVTWLTWDDPITTQSLVFYGLTSTNLDVLVSGNAYTFTDIAPTYTNRTIHVATMTGLKPNTKYFYKVGDIERGMSDTLWFTSAPDLKLAHQTSPQKYLVFADMGSQNSQALTSIIDEVQTGNVNMITHMGDFAYDLYQQNGKVGDEYMRNIQAFAAHVPYLTAPGNHEFKYNFSFYSQHFRGQPSNSGTVQTGAGELPNSWWYSYNYGLVHFITLSSEVYYDFPWLIKRQYDWFVEDLKQAQMKRKEIPWIVVQAHRPFYTSVPSNIALKMRDGVYDNRTKKYVYGIEHLLFAFGVDFYFSGHVHNYERFYDIYKNESSYKTVNPGATVYLVSGCAGGSGGLDAFTRPQPMYSAFRSSTYGYTRFHVYNATHVHWQYVMTDTSQPISNWRKVVDETWFVQERHGPFEVSKLRVSSDYWRQASKMSTTLVAGDPFAKRLPGFEDVMVDVEYLGEDKGMYCRFEQVTC